MPIIEASLAAADWTITIGENTEKALAERYGVFAHRIANAVDTDVFRPSSSAVSKRTVVFIGWDGAAFKGIDIARRVARGLAARRPEVGVVWITPNAPLGAKMGETVVNPPQEVLVRYLREASVYVGTSRYESWGLPALEAMACGTPVVSTDNGGIRSYGRDGENCLLAPVDDPDALMAAVIRVLDDASLAEDLASAGLETAAAYSWPVITAELLEDFRALVDTLPPAPPAAIEMAVDDLEFDHEPDRARLKRSRRGLPLRAIRDPGRADLRTASTASRAGRSWRTRRAASKASGGPIFRPARRSRSRTRRTNSA